MKSLILNVARILLNGRTRNVLYLPLKNPKNLQYFGVRLKTKRIWPIQSWLEESDIIMAKELSKR